MIFAQLYIPRYTGRLVSPGDLRFQYRTLGLRKCRTNTSRISSSPHNRSTESRYDLIVPTIALGLLGTALTLANPTAAHALHPEPSNALSLPTWAVHTSSVIEWATAMALMWRYAEVSGNQRWKGMAWGMVPSLAAAMCACTWHFFYNSSDLQWLVLLQSFLTIVGNATCWIAAYRIYTAASTVNSK